MPLRDAAVPVKSKAPEFERLTRIVCHSPLNRKPNQQRPNQIHVVREFMDYLKKTNLTGFTMSSFLDTVYTGFWRPSTLGEFEEENVVLFAIDHPLEKNDPELWAFVAELKSEIQKLYKRHARAKEQDVWIVMYSIDRLV
jgi:hypothetical protein